MDRLTVKLPPGLLDAFRAAVLEDGRTMRGAVRIALEGYLVARHRTRRNREEFEAMVRAAAEADEAEGDRSRAPEPHAPAPG